MTLDDRSIRAGKNDSPPEFARYRMMRLIRRMEEKIIELYPSDKIKSPVHLSIGQEAIAVGVCEALDAVDVVFGTYRGHALYLAKGGSPQLMMAELFGKVGGGARGKAGSMHLIDLSVNMMGTSAIVATTIPNAVGYALAQKMKKAPVVTVVFFGEGATDEGVFYESLNFAALKKLPILFVCENNLYAIYSHVRDRMAGGLSGRAAAFGVPYQLVEDNEAASVSQAAMGAIDRIRRGDGPQFLECSTYRWRDHVGPDEDRIQGYRPDAELDRWIAADPVAKARRALTQVEAADIDLEVESLIAGAVAFAEESPFPENAEALEHVYSR